MISIIIVSKDRQAYIDRQVRELNKWLPDLGIDVEVVFYDDGSIEPLNVVNCNFNYKSSRIEKNVGLIQARNNAVDLTHANSKYLFFLDDDIFIFNFISYVEAALTAIDEGYTGVSLPFINLPTFKYEQLSTFKHIIDVKGRDDCCVYFFGGTSIFLKSDFIDAGGLEGEYFIYLEEEDFALRLFDLGKKLKVLYGNNFIGIHDQAQGKDWDERGIYLLSNRLLYHYKFVSNPIIHYSLNTLYVFAYFIKFRSWKKINRSFNRYRNKKVTVSKVNIKTSAFLRFLVKRYFNF